MFHVQQHMLLDRQYNFSAVQNNHYPANHQIFSAFLQKKSPTESTKAGWRIFLSSNFTSEQHQTA